MQNLSDSFNFRFGVGDKVRFRITKKLGVVISRSAYPEIGPDNIFYKVQLPDDSIWMAKEEDLEPPE